VLLILPMVGVATTGTGAGIEAVMVEEEVVVMGEILRGAGAGEGGGATGMEEEEEEEAGDGRGNGEVVAEEE